VTNRHFKSGCINFRTSLLELIYGLANPIQIISKKTLETLFSLLKLRRKTIMKAKDLINDLVQVNAFGHNFVAYKMTENKDKETGELLGYRVESNIQDDKSPYRFQTLNVKIKTVNPTIKQINDVFPVDFKNLTCTFINDYGETYWAADDVVPLSTK